MKESKTEQNSGGKKGLHGFNFALLCLVIVVFVVSVIVFSVSALEANEKREQIEEKKDKIAELEKSINEYEYYIGLPMDSDYVAKIAREKLNMHYPDEVIEYGENIGGESN